VIDAPPEHVRAAFGVPADVPQLLSGGRGQAYRCGSVVLKPVSDHAEASWLAGTFEQLSVPGVRIARPVRSSDGRWVIAGWTAHRFVSGRTAPRFDEVIAVGLALHEALAGVAKPRFLDVRDDLYAWADRISWGDLPAADDRLGDGVGATAFATLAAGRRPIELPHQLVHGDLTGNVLFAGSAPPAVIDITPYWRPVSWATAVVVVDAIAWGGADLDLATGQQTAHWRQVLRRALMCRLAVSLGHPRSTPASMVGVLSAVERLSPLLDDDLPGLSHHSS
jgi:uncharacterized protein (TIGR02569 family)